MIEFKTFLPKEGNINDIVHFITSKDEYLFPPISQILDLKTYSEKLHNNATIFTAEVDNIIIGMCAGYLNNDNNLSYISYLCVDAMYQNKSVGSKLLNQALDYFRTKKSIGAWISMNSSDKKLYVFYQKHGFKFLNDDLFSNTDIKKTNLVIYF